MIRSYFYQFYWQDFSSPPLSGDELYIVFLSEMIRFDEIYYEQWNLKKKKKHHQKNCPV